MTKRMVRSKAIFWNSLLTLPILILVIVFFSLPGYGSIDHEKVSFAIYNFIMLFSNDGGQAILWWLIMPTGFVALLGVFGFFLYGFHVRHGEKKSFSPKLYVVFLIAELLLSAYLIFWGWSTYDRGNGDRFSLVEQHYIHFLIIAVVMAAIAVAQTIHFLWILKKENRGQGA